MGPDNMPNAPGFPEVPDMNNSVPPATDESIVVDEFEGEDSV